MRHVVAPWRVPHAVRQPLRAASLFVLVLLWGHQGVFAQQLPSPWAAADIGGPAVGGRATSSDGRAFQISAAGYDIWNGSDEFHFVYQQITGDVEILARIDAIAPTHGWAKAGVMIRSSLAANAAHAFALVSAAKGTAFQRRAAAAGTSTHTAGPVLTSPSWVRLWRDGTTVTAAISTDGSQWTTIASDTIALGATVYVGLAVTSHNTAAATDAAISQVTVTQEASDPALPSPFQSADVGSPATPGNATHSAGSFTVMAAGADVWGTSDQFHYVYQPITGDVDVRARVQSISYQHRWSKAGLMVRESLTPGSRHAFALMSAGAGNAFQRRVDPEGLSTSTAGWAATPPGWVRLVRTGDRFEAFQSTDGAAWTLIGSETIPMTASVYVGLAVTSHNEWAAAQAAFDNVTITVSNPPANESPAVSIASPAEGSTFVEPAAFTLSAHASDTDGSVARVEFYRDTTLIATDTQAPFSTDVSALAAGSYSFTARAFDDDGASTLSPAVSVTVSAPNQAPTAAITSPANGATFVAPAAFTVSATASDPDGTVARVEFYRDTTLIATDTQAPFSTDVSALAAGTYSFTARALDDDGTSTVSAAVSVTVSAPNQAPAAAITSPVNGATFVAPAAFTVTATASDPDGTVARVEFYLDGSLLGSDTTAPYTVAVSGLSAGTYSFTARAFDNDGASTVSAAVSVTVSAPNQAPTAAITSPADGATFVAPASFTVSATASDPDGTVARVEFYRNGTLVGSDTSSPYSVAMASVPAGSYSFTAVAYDAAGATTSSAAITVTVSAAPPPPPPRAVAFTASADHADNVTRYVLEIFAAGADPATATPIATSDLGKPAPDAANDITVDRSAFFSGMAAGDYIAVVRAEGPGGSSRSAGVAFTR